MTTRQEAKDAQHAAYAAALAGAHAAAVAAVAAEVAARPEDVRALDCGFAWAEIPDGNEPFVRWCRGEIKKIVAADPKRAGAGQYGEKHWHRGWYFWEPGRFVGQSVRVHRVGATAFAEHLQRELGLRDCRAASRLD